MAIGLSSLRIPASRVAKLVETLLDKYFYVCHFRNLKFNVEKGVKVERLRGELQFDKSCWLDKYIRKNTALRQRAKKDFDKLFQATFKRLFCQDIRKLAKS